MIVSLSEDLLKIKRDIEGYARGYGLDFFDTIFEMVDYQQINALASYGGFPVRYPHWRFGMDYDQFSKGHEWGLQKIYEMVINTDPSYAYLLSSNSITDNKTVIAHVYGHVDFFKNNYWFSKTNRKMLDTMANHAVKIRGYMDRYGQERVETFIDHCLSLENLIDPFLPFEEAEIEKRRRDQEHAQRWGAGDARPQENENKLKVDREYMSPYINPKDFVDSQRKRTVDEKEKAKKIPDSPQKDVLRFLLQYAPLEDWEREVLRIIRDEAYYFIPQMQTKIMNEGWASYWHSKIMTEKALKDSEIIDFADAHAGTLAMQPGRLNPYKVGIELFRDIEDRWNRGKFGKAYDECDDIVAKEQWDTKAGLGRQKIFEVRKVCNDLMFIDNYLTMEFAIRHKLYTFEFNRRTNQYEIAEREFKKVKDKMLTMLTNMGNPFIYVTDGNFENRGELLLWHKHQGVDLDHKYARETLRALQELWRRPINIETTVESQRKLLSINKGEFSERLL